MSPTQPPGRIAAVKADAAQLDHQVDRLRAAAESFAGGYAAAALLFAQMAERAETAQTVLAARAEQINAEAGRLHMAPVCTVPSVAEILDAALAAQGVHLPPALSFTGATSRGGVTRG